jgi:tetratricopeptide (TPR) repeat protein
VAVVLGFAPRGVLADAGGGLEINAGGGPMPSITHAIHALNEGRTTEALAYCDHAIKRYPSHMWAHFCRGDVLLARGENDAAVPEFSGVIAGHPGIAVFYIFRGEAYLRARRTSEAIADFNSAMAEAGVDTYWYANALALRSLAAELRRDFDPAMKDFDHAMRAVNGDFSGNYEMLGNRCYAAAVAGLLDSAQESCDASIKLHERNEAAYDSRGLVDLKSGHWDAAIADYTKSLYYRPDFTFALYGRGLAKRARGDSAGAAADMEAAQKNEPEIATIMTRLVASSATTPKPK